LGLTHRLLSLPLQQHVTSGLNRWFPQVCNANRSTYPGCDFTRSLAATWEPKHAAIASANPKRRIGSSLFDCKARIVHSTFTEQKILSHGYPITCATCIDLAEIRMRFPFGWQASYLAQRKISRVVSGARRKSGVFDTSDSMSAQGH
jgi:hypothetical protein